MTRDKSLVGNYSSAYVRENYTFIDSPITEVAYLKTSVFGNYKTARITVSDEKSDL